MKNSFKRLRCVQFNIFTVVKLWIRANSFCLNFSRGKQFTFQGLVWWNCDSKSEFSNKSPYKYFFYVSAWTLINACYITHVRHAKKKVTNTRCAWYLSFLLYWEKFWLNLIPHKIWKNLQKYIIIILKYPFKGEWANETVAVKW